MRALRSVLTNLGRAPLKSSALLATVSLGVAVLVFALSISNALARLISERLERDGLVVTVIDGRPSPHGPPHDLLDQQGVEALMSDVPGAAAASLVASAWSDEYLANGTVYQVRKAVMASDSYVRVMGLEMIAGANVDATHQALISATLAEVLFGSATAALGQTLRTAPPTITVYSERPERLEDQMVATRRSRMRSYTVRGVFADPDELRRRVYGIADMVVSLGSDTRTSSLHTIALRVTGSRFPTVESHVQAAMLRQYEAPVRVLQGSTTSDIEGLDPRLAVRALSLVVNLLAVLILVTGGVGLLSLMMVEVLSRSRQIALSRAFGATKGAIVREYLARSLIMVGAASVLGIVLSLFLSGPLTALVMPIFQDAAEIDLTGPVITPAAVAAGVAAALGVGGLLGPLPVFSALAAPIAEGIRD